METSAFIQPSIAALYHRSVARVYGGCRFPHVTGGVGGSMAMVCGICRAVRRRSVLRCR